jgi:hypothetical protein
MLVEYAVRDGKQGTRELDGNRRVEEDLPILTPRPSLLTPRRRLVAMVKNRGGCAGRAELRSQDFGFRYVRLSSRLR